jgi:cytochrome c
MKNHHDKPATRAAIPHTRALWGLGLLGTTVMLAAAPLTASAQDVNAGKTAYAQCVACHSVDGTNGAGPTLKGLLGTKAGAVPGFRFSRAMKNSAIVWDAKTLDAYLANPQAAIPGNTMPYSGVADSKVRADLIAYIATLK